MQIVLRILQGFLLFLVLVIVGMAYLVELLGEGIDRNPKVVLGVRPIGVGTIVHLWARGIAWISTRIRGLLGVYYVQRFFPRFYQRSRILFRPRRRRRP